MIQFSNVAKINNATPETMNPSNLVTFMAFIFLTTLISHLKTAPAQEDWPNYDSVTSYGNKMVLD